MGAFCEGGSGLSHFDADQDDAAGVCLQFRKRRRKLLRGWEAGSTVFKLQLLILQSLPSVADVLVDPQSIVNGRVSGLLARHRVMPAGE